MTLMLISLYLKITKYLYSITRNEYVLQTSVTVAYFHLKLKQSSVILPYSLHLFSSYLLNIYYVPAWG